MVSKGEMYYMYYAEIISSWTFVRDFGTHTDSVILDGSGMFHL